MIGMQARARGPTTNSYKLIHLSGNESRPTAIRVEYFIISEQFFILVVSVLKITAGLVPNENMISKHYKKMVGNEKTHN